MSGQATITIKNKQWSVSVAVTPSEQAQGLGELPGIPAGTGMLFDMGVSQTTIQVTTVPMLFPLDIAFLSETLVITEVYRNIQPGYLITSNLPSPYFLEVNAGELEGIDIGDQASVQVVGQYYTPAPYQAMQWEGILGTLMGIATLVSVGAQAFSLVRKAVRGE